MYEYDWSAYGTHQDIPSVMLVVQAMTSLPKIRYYVSFHMLHN